jgi:hypothetical protein
MLRTWLPEVTESILPFAQPQAAPRQAGFAESGGGSPDPTPVVEVWS